MIKRLIDSFRAGATAALLVLVATPAAAQASQVLPMG